MIYLDHHSETPPCSDALEQMTLCLKEHWRPFSHKKLEARDQPIYDLVGAKIPDRFVFTSSGAEGVNQVFLSVFLEVARKTGKTHFIVSSIEDAPTLRSAKRLEELGCTIKIAPIRDGAIDLDALEKLISPRTALISTTLAHGLTGVIQPASEILEMAREKKVLVHFDATYAVGKYPLEFQSDYLTFSGDRIHSVKGSGALFAKADAPLVPLILGGSFDFPSFLSLSSAARLALLYIDTMVLEGVRLRNLLESLVHGKVLYRESFRLPNTSLIAFEKIHQEALLYFLNRKGVFATIGGSQAPSLSTIDETAISFSLSRMTTEEEIIQAAKIINEAVRELQLLSEDL